MGLRDMAGREHVRGMSSRTLTRSRARPAPRGAAALTALAALAALAVAFTAEWWGEMIPCALCLLERWPYRIAVALGLLALVLPPVAARAALWLAVAAVLAGAALAAVHVGVEFRWWPSPLPECAAPHLSGSIADRLAEMPARPSKPCDDPTYLVPFLPVSMAAMNMLFALAFAALLAMSLASRTRSR
jgi:disulfide bond formation protein DsbB